MINLEKIANEHNYYNGESVLHDTPTARSFAFYEMLQDICEQVIDECTEQATAKIERTWEGNTGSESYYDTAVVNKQSILTLKTAIQRPLKRTDKW